MEVEAVLDLLRLAAPAAPADILFCTAGCGNVEEGVRGIGAGWREDGTIGVLAPDIILGPGG